MAFRCVVYRQVCRATADVAVVVAHRQFVSGSIFEHAASSANRTAWPCIVRISSLLPNARLPEYPTTQTEKAQADGRIREACVEAVYLSCTSLRTGGGDALTYPAQTCLINEAHYTTERLRMGLSQHCILHYLEAEAGSIIRSVRFIKAFERAVSVSSDPRSILKLRSRKLPSFN